MAGTLPGPKEASLTSSDTVIVNGGLISEMVEEELSMMQEAAVNSIIWSGSFVSSSGENKTSVVENRPCTVDNDDCGNLRRAAADMQSHVQKLDEMLSLWVRCEAQAEKTNTDEIAKQVISVLSRLQCSPSPLEVPPAPLPDEYFARGRDWADLYVASFVPRALIRLITYSVTIKGHQSVSGYHDILNGIGILIDAVCSREADLQQSSDPQGYLWYIVRAFLWSFWQRTRTLHSYFILCRNLSVGLSFGNETFADSPQFSVRPGISLATFCAESARQKKPQNMCTWAFNLVQNESSCLGLDFRVLHKRFSYAFHNVAARCRPGFSTSCDGLGPNCLRYKGALVIDQSAHDLGCAYTVSREPTLRWDEASYRSVKGARAVDVSTSVGSMAALKYCSASHKTLAISHVWSHGQGGRPESGINTCLHQRYCKIVQQLGCDSYWMDTVSIPENHDLRREAISHINEVFQSSQVVLVCDKDLMNLDVSNMTSVVQEAVVATVLFCDWSVRAWTLLEGLKGRQNIYLLCKNDLTINFRELLLEVCQIGRLDLIVFANLFPHLLPPEEGPLDGVAHGGIPEISIELAGCWLSHRPASRPEDEIVIWSLLLGSRSPPRYNAIDFWKAQTNVCTGYLMSSNPRLTDSGFTWAPSTPYTMVQQPGLGSKMDCIFHPMPRSETGFGGIRKTGLWARWYFFEFRTKRSPANRSTITSSGTSVAGANAAQESELDNISDHFGLFEPWAALLQPVPMSETKISGSKALHTVRSDRYGLLFAICESDKKESQDETSYKGFRSKASYRWRWKGVYEWPENVAPPTLSINPALWLG